LCMSAVSAFGNVSSDISLSSNEMSLSSEESILKTGPVVEDIKVAVDFGTLKSKYAGSGDKIIIHIQDAHCNFEAQQNITKILDHMVKNYGVDMICVEGAEGVVDTSWFKAFPDEEIREEVATYFMKKGEITGTEFYSIISDDNGVIFGA